MSANGNNQVMGLAKNVLQKHDNFTTPTRICQKENGQIVKISHGVISYFTGKCIILKQIHFGLVPRISVNVPL
jgi:hypothetical protein